MPDTTNTGPYKVQGVNVGGHDWRYHVEGPTPSDNHTDEPAHAELLARDLNAAFAAGRAAAQADLDVAREALSVVVSIIPPGCICGNNGGGDCDWCSAVSTACAALAKLEAKP